MLFISIMLAVALFAALTACLLAPASTDVADARVIAEADARVAAVHEHSLVCIREAYVNGYERGFAAGRDGHANEVVAPPQCCCWGCTEPMTVAALDMCAACADAEWREYAGIDEPDVLDEVARTLGAPVVDALDGYHDYVAEKALDRADHTAAIVFEYERSLHAQETACAVCGPRCDCIPF